MSLCFQQAFARVRRGEDGFSQYEYHKQLLQHLKGIRHPSDGDISVALPLTKFEPWVASLREICLGETYDPLQGELMILVSLTKPSRLSFQKWQSTRQPYQHATMVNSSFSKMLSKPLQLNPDSLHSCNHRLALPRRDGITAFYDLVLSVVQPSIHISLVPDKQVKRRRTCFRCCWISIGRTSRIPPRSKSTVLVQTALLGDGCERML